MNSMFHGCFALTTIYVSDKFVVDQVTSSDTMFNECNALVGGNGTAYINGKNDGVAYAHIDVAGNPGYFSGK